MTKSAMDLLDTAFIGPGLLFLNQYFDTPLPEHLLLWIALVREDFELPDRNKLVDHFFL